jgi:hypothetical protein
MACTNCANACKRCDEARPCERCIKYGVHETCVDGTRKERQKGIKRGPYKRKGKTANSNRESSFVAANDESEWPATDGTPQNTDGGQPPPPIQAMPHYPPPEGFYPYFYPPPPGFIPPGHEGQSPPDGATNATNHPPMVPYYPLAPPGFFPHYAAAVTPGAFPPPSHGTPVTTIVPAEGSRNTEADEHTNGTGKKRSRAGKSGKSKKHKAAATTQGSPTSGGAAGGSEHASDPGANSPPEHDD